MRSNIIIKRANIIFFKFIFFIVKIEKKITTIGNNEARIPDLPVDARLNKNVIIIGIIGYRSKFLCLINAIITVNEISRSDTLFLFPIKTPLSKTKKYMYI